MKRKPIDFRELLEHLLPLERLPPADRTRVQRALVSGVQLGLEAWAQLEPQVLPHPNSRMSRKPRAVSLVIRAL